MKTVTVSSKGQIAIPKDVMASLHIEGGNKMLFEVRDGKIVLEPVISVPRSQAWFWTPEVQKKIKKVEQEYKAGKSRAHNAKELLKTLNDE